MGAKKKKVMHTRIHMHVYTGRRAEKHLRSDARCYRRSPLRRRVLPCVPCVCVCVCVDVDVGRTHADPLSSSSWNGAAVELSEYVLTEERKEEKKTTGASRVWRRTYQDGEEREAADRSGDDEGDEGQGAMRERRIQGSRVPSWLP